MLLMHNYSCSPSNSKLKGMGKKTDIRVSPLSILHTPVSFIKSSLHKAAVQANLYHKEVTWQQELFEMAFNALNWRVNNFSSQKSNTFKHLHCAYVFFSISIRTSTVYKTKKYW